MDENGKTFTIKRNNVYNVLSNESLQFLDITNFLAPGTSYAASLKAYGIREKKGFFQYEWFDDFEKLNCLYLPPFGDAWYSHTKRKNVLDDGENTPEDNYAWLQEKWSENHMNNFKYFLIWYNNRDVAPFVSAVKKLYHFYENIGIDVFKVAISAPGIARRILFDTATEAGAYFTLFDESNRDLYETIKRNITGGPSIIFNRHHKADVSLIRGAKQTPCKSIVGYDANALYLWAIDQSMPVGTFVRRKIDDGFKPQVKDKYLKMYQWMDWLNYSENRNILHKLNSGREKRVGPYLVDGFDPQTNTVYEFLGCYHHGHNPCDLLCYSDEPTREMTAKFNRTKERSQFIREEGFIVVEKWECSFNMQCKHLNDLQSYVDSFLPKFYQTHKSTVSVARLLEAVRKNEIFGMLEVDIRVPDSWSLEFRSKFNLSPEHYFSEMSPLFCTANLPFDSIGAHMQEHAREHQLSEKDRKLLVGGMRGKKMMIATPLLKWYLDHGMCVTKNYQVVEFCRKACF